MFQYQPDTPAMATQNIPLAVLKSLLLLLQGFHIRLGCVLVRFHAWHGIAPLITALNSSNAAKLSLQLQTHMALLPCLSLLPCPVDLPCQHSPPVVTTAVSNCVLTQPQTDASYVDSAVQYAMLARPSSANPDRDYSAARKLGTRSNAGLTDDDRMTVMTCAVTTRADNVECSEQTNTGQHASVACIPIRHCCVVAC